jgi:hypothetical protein
MVSAWLGAEGSAKGAAKASAARAPIALAVGLTRFLFRRIMSRPSLSRLPMLPRVRFLASKRLVHYWGNGVARPPHAPRSALNLSLTWSAVQTPRASQSDGRKSSSASFSAAVRSGSGN